jgi:UDP-N-acetyl-D-mannosaminuronate dehydrogenase
MHINKITVVGLGYVGLAQALLFNEDYNVVGYDTDTKVVASLNRGILHIKDEDFARALARKKLMAIKLNLLFLICMMVMPQLLAIILKMLSILLILFTLFDY